MPRRTARMPLQVMWNNRRLLLSGQLRHTRLHTVMASDTLCLLRDCAGNQVDLELAGVLSRLAELKQKRGKLQEVCLTRQ